MYPKYYKTYTILTNGILNHIAYSGYRKKKAKTNHDKEKR